MNNYSINISASDQSGNNLTAVIIIQVNSSAIDTTAPQVLVISPSGYYSTNNITFSINLSENGTVLFNLNNGTNTLMATSDNIAFTNTTLLLSDGAYSAYFFGNDSSNNLGTNSTTFTIDTTYPTIDYASGTDNDGSYVNRNYILINLSGNDTNLINISLRIYYSNGTIYNYTTNTSSSLILNLTLSAGIYYYNATIIDNVGHQINTSTRNITVDLTTPSVTINFPSNNYRFNNGTINLNITLNDTNLANTTIQIYNSTSIIINSTSTSNNITIDANLSDGNYSYNITTYDRANNVNITSGNIFIVDVTEPQLTVASPIATTYNDTFSILFNSTINEAGTIWFNINNGTNYTMNTTDNLTFTYTNNSIVNGNYTVYFFANDSAGNINNSVYVAFAINTTNLFNITITSPSSGAVITSDPMTLSVTLNHNGTVTFSYNNGSYQSCFNNSFSGSCSVSSLTDGAGTIIINATNMTNYSIQSNVTFTVSISSGGGGGGSGGGGGGSSGSSGASYSSNSSGSSSNESSYSRVWLNIVRGERTVSISRVGVPVTEISMIINYSNSSQSQNLVVKATTYNPTDKKLNADIYKFIIIDADIEEEQYNSMNMKFRIEDDWLTNNSLIEENLTVYRYDKGSEKWIIINKVILNNESNSTNYTYYNLSIYANDLLALGTPILPEKIVPIVTKIEENETDTQNSKDESETTKPEVVIIDTAQASNSEFISKIEKSISQSYNQTKEYLMSIPKQTQILLILMISSTLLLLTLSVGGTLLYRRIRDSKQHSSWMNHYKRHGSIVSYEQEPPLQNPPLKITPSNMPEAPVKEGPEKIVEKSMPERPLTTPELIVRKIDQLLQQSEYSLDNGKYEDAKKLYLDSKKLYFDSNIGYEYKSKVYDKMMKLHNRIYK